LNWQRPGNLLPILGSIAAQAVPARVVIWNNGALLPPAVSGHWLVQQVVTSPNLGCMPRWWLASLSRTEWVCSLDDDLCFAADDALEVALRRAQGEDCILGAFGVQLIEGAPYKAGRHVNTPAVDERVDIVKGRFMLLRRSLLERVPLHLPAPGFSPEVGDDILLSVCLARGRSRAHLLPGGLRGKFRELPAGSVAVEAQPGHWERRQRTVQAVAGWIMDNGFTTKSTKDTKGETA
jgi:hypothetical protein